MINKITIFISLLIAFTSCSSNTIDPTGTYKLESETEIRNEDTYGYFGSIDVKKIESEKIVMSFFVCRGAPSYNMGMFLDTIDYINDKAVYTCDKLDSSCIINFYFSKKGIKVEEKTEDVSFGCGFGHGVQASGFYKVKSRKTPIIKDPFNSKRYEILNY
jgi:hypothetical protein